MASTGAEREEPHLPRDEPRHPEPAFREAQKWIEEVTGKSFGEKDFRSGLENGILLCELLCSIRPGLVQKINRLPSPIAGLDNLSVFLRGCEELGLKGSQLFNPGDLQDTSIQANLRDSECSRKLKNVLITIFWLGKASSMCPAYDGPVLNLREFEGLRSHMRTLSEDRSGSDSVRPGVRDSGYDCWDSERSQSLSPRQHTRDNSLDSLDSFGSRSQTSPSPDVMIHGNSDVDSDGDAPNRKADVRRDDMLARRTSAGESRTFVPFNQFLPNRNVSAYVPTARRRSRPQDGEHGSLPQPILEEGRGGEGGGPFKRPPGPRSRNAKTVTWAPDGEGPKEEEGGLGQEEEVLKREVEEHRRLQRLEKAGIKVLPAVIRYGRPTPHLEQQEVRSQSPDIILRRNNDFLTNQKAAWDSDSEGDAEGEEGGGGVRRIPDVRRDDLASRRAPRPPAASRVYQYIPPPACSLRDRELWEDIRRASHTALMDRMELERSAKEAVCDIITRRDNPFLSPASQREEEEEEEEGRGVKVPLPNKTKDDLARRRGQNRPRPSHRDGPMSFVHASITQSDLEKWERLKMSEPSESSPSPVCQACLEKGSGTPDIISLATGSMRGCSKVVTFGGVTELEEQPISSSREGEESQLLRRLLAKATVAMPIIALGFQLSEQQDSNLGGVDTSHTPPPKPGPSPPSPEAPPTLLELEARLAQYERREREDEEDGGRDERKVPDLQMDDMMARKTGAFPRTPVTTTTTFNRFLPLPGSKRAAQEVVTDRKLQPCRVSLDVPQQHPNVAMVVRPSAPSHCNYDDDEDEEECPVPDLEKDDMLARRTGAYQRSAGGTGRSFNLFLPVPGAAQQKKTPSGGPNQRYKNTPAGGPNQPHKNTPSGGPNQLYRHKQQPSSGISTATGTEAPHSRTPTRKCLEDKPYLSSPSSPFTPSHTLTPPPTPPLPQLSGREKMREEGMVRGAEIEMVGGKERGKERETERGEETERGREKERGKEIEMEERGKEREMERGEETERGREKERGKEIEKEIEMEERGKERGEETEMERGKKVGESHRRQFWMEDNDLPPMILSRRVSKMSEELESISIINMHSKEEGAGLLQPLGQSRYDGMQEQYTNHQGEEEEWQDDLARWKSRRRSASQDLIRKEEERKRMERMIKEEEGGNTQKKKNIKTYREIVEDKERREAELCDAYRRAGSKEEAAMVLQRYALRFTISDSTLDSLQLPRTITTDQNPESRTSATNQNPESRTPATNQNPKSRTTTTDQNPESRTSATNQNPESRTPATNQNPESRTPATNQNPKSRTITTDQNPESRTSATNQNPESRTITTDQNHNPRTITNNQNSESRTITTNQNPESRTPATNQNPNPRTINTTQNSESRTITNDQNPESRTITTDQNLESRTISTDQNPKSRTITSDQNTESRTITTNLNPESRTITTDQNIESRTIMTNQNSESRTIIANQNPESRTTTADQNPDSRTTTTDQNPDRAGNGLEARQTDTKQEPRAPKQPQISVTHTKHTHTQQTQLQTQHTQNTHTQNHSTQSQHTLPPPISPPSRPLPLLTAKPYCQPPQTQPGHKPVKVDGLVRVNGETLPSSPPSSPLQPPSSPLHSPPPTEHPGANQKTQMPAVSALIGGRNCVVTTTIVTELTQTHLQPRLLDMLSNTQVNGSMALSRRSGEDAASDSSLLSNQHTYSSSVTGGLEGSSGTMESPMLKLAKRVDHWVWNPEEERKRQEKWQLEQERFLQEQYLREQEKLKGEWERAQREVDEEERRHNEEEKRILEETATALSHLPPTELPVQTEVIVPAQQIYASWDCESSRGQETSLDLNQPCAVKRSGSYDGPHPPSSSPSSPQPPSPSRCVSGKRQCSGCNQVLGKGTAMNIDTLGLYFHLACFKCGVCKVQLGDTSSGTDVRIRNGLLSCHNCYATSHAGQPTTL
ncbi:LIM domain only protein 7-like isoform X2 [Salvelinus alpinus]|uniref:LIM domain only protein 7-like isoform X2 n=1 Tax=Salvelinus alpinus TaxID=8036 RepID=UPI0039FCE3C4